MGRSVGNVNWKLPESHVQSRYHSNQHKPRGKNKIMQRDTQLKVFLIGKNGRTLQETIKRALQKGYFITTYVSDAQSILQTFEGEEHLHVVQGHYFDAEYLADLMRSHQVVICIFEPEFPSSKQDTAQFVEQIFTAMLQNSISRFVCCSSERQHQKFGCFGRMIKRCAMKQFFRIMDSLEAYVENTPTSQISWTIVHSHELTNEPYTGLCQLWTRDSVSNGSVATNFQTPRSDLADFLLEQISDCRYIGKTVQIALPEDTSSSWSFYRM